MGESWKGIEEGKNLGREGRRPRIKKSFSSGKGYFSLFNDLFYFILFVVQKDDRSMRQTVIYVKGKRHIWGHLF